MGKQNPSKRSGKKDRHSKICTAQGLRDRRMRLSLKVARRFFDLQDMLGFDKASKTIDWLLSNCKAAIHKLTRNHIIDSNYAAQKLPASSEESEVESESPVGGAKACKEKRKRRKSSSDHYSVAIARESREKARARARERTREKMMIRKSHIIMTAQPINPQISKHSPNFSAQEINSSSPEARRLLEEASVAVMEDLLGIKRSSSSSTFSYNSPAQNGADQFQAFLGMEEARIEAAAGCYAITSRKPTTSVGNVNAPNAMLRTTLNSQVHSSNSATTQAQPISSFLTSISSNAGHVQWNPSSIPVTPPNPSTVVVDQLKPFPTSVLVTTSSNSLQPIPTPSTHAAFTPTNSNLSFHSHFLLGNQFL